MLLNCDVGEDSWESLGLKEIQPVHPKGNQSWIFIGKTDAEAETPILWPVDEKSWLIWEDPDAGKDWRWEEKGMTEDEIVGWHHWLKGHEFEYTPGVGDGQGSLVCYSPWDHSQTQLSDWTELNLPPDSFLQRNLENVILSFLVKWLWNSEGVLLSCLLKVFCLCFYLFQ